MKDESDRIVYFVQIHASLCKQLRQHTGCRLIVIIQKCSFHQIGNPSLNFVGIDICRKIRSKPGIHDFTVCRCLFGFLIYIYICDNRNPINGQVCVHSILILIDHAFQVNCLDKLTLFFHGIICCLQDPSILAQNDSGYKKKNKNDKDYNRANNRNPFFRRKSFLWSTLCIRVRLLINRLSCHRVKSGRLFINRLPCHRVKSHVHFHSPPIVHLQCVSIDHFVFFPTRHALL